MTQIRSNRKIIILFSTVVAVLITAGIYWPGLSGEFMLDDLQNIVSIQKDPSLSAAVYYITHNDSGLLGRSVSIFSFFLTLWQFGPDAWGYKFHNLLIHLVTGLLLARLFYLTLNQFAAGLGKNRMLMISGLSAFLWLVHPFLVSTVLYAVQRMAQLASMFTVLALLVYLKVRTMEKNTWSFYWRAWLLFPCCMVLAVLSKENGVLIPVYILAYEVIGFKSGMSYFNVNRHQGFFLGIFVVLPILLGMFMLLTRLDDFTDYSNRSFTLSGRLLTELHVLAFYVQMIFVPRLREMSLFHDDFAVSSSLDAGTLVLLFLLIAVLVSIWKLRKSQPIVALGLAWFLVSHLLESTILPLELVFEHRNYLAAAGLILLPVYLVFAFDLLRPVRFVCVLFALIFIFMTMARAKEWGDYDLALVVAITEHPQSSRSHNAMANRQMELGNLDKAIEQLQISDELTQQDPGTSLHLLGAKCVNGIQDDDAYKQSVSRLGQFPITVYALNALENLIKYINMGKCPTVTLDEFGELINTAMGFEKNLSDPLYRAYLKRFQGIYFLTIGQYAQGVIAFRQAHEYTGQVFYLAELARFQIDLKQLDDAQDTFELMQEENAKNFGIENYQVDVVKKYLTEARNTAAGQSEIMGEGQNPLEL